MKVVYLIHSLSGAGTTRQAALICEELASLGMDITLLVGSRTGVNKSEFETVDYPVEYLSDKLMGYAAFVWRLTKYLRRNPDCLLLSGAKKVNIKAIDAHRLSGHKGELILTLTNNIAQFNSQTGISKTASLKKHYRKYQFADKVIVISRAMQAELEANGFSPDKLAFCPPPIDISTMQEKAVVAVDHPWLQMEKSAREIPVILSAGRYDPQKNFPLLIKAFAKARENRAMRLIIMGSGEAARLSAYQSLADELDVSEDIDFAGFQANPFAFMSRSDLFVLSSDWEGFGLVLAEALVCGASVLSTDCPHGPVEILEGTDNTALTPVGDADAMAKAILDILAKKASSALNNAGAMSRYDKAAIGQAYKTILEGLD